MQGSDGDADAENTLEGRVQKARADKLDSGMEVHESP